MSTSFKPLYETEVDKGRMDLEKPGTISPFLSSFISKVHTIKFSCPSIHLQTAYFMCSYKYKLMVNLHISYSEPKKVLQLGWLHISMVKSLLWADQLLLKRQKVLKQG